MAELENQLHEALEQAETSSNSAAQSSVRISELEQQVLEADMRHTNDLEKAERMGQELISLREQAADREKTQQRVDELEQALTATQHQLSDASARLARLFQ